MVEILDIQKNFYQKLYKSKDVTYRGFGYLKKVKVTKLTDQQKLELDCDISGTKIIECIKQMKMEKVPGIDGLPIEFYRVFYCKFQEFFNSVISEIAEKGFTLNQGHGIISLMDKPGRDLLFIKNWHPLSLLNVDSKIYSKILANKLHKVLPNLIHKDQSGFMKGCTIGENLLDELSIIEHCEQNEISALLIAIDFEKAFDTVNWQSFYAILNLFNFGPRYISMVKNLFKNNTSCTINNGWSSEWMNIGRGLRQGDCFPPPAFLLVMEVLGQILGQNNKIKGIKIDCTEKQHAQFADDLWTSLMADQEMVDEFFKDIDQFSELTSLKINYDKTQIMRIGSLKDSNANCLCKRQLHGLGELKSWVSPSLPISKKCLTKIIINYYYE